MIFKKILGSILVIVLTAVTILFLFRYDISAFLINRKIDSIVDLNIEKRSNSMGDFVYFSYELNPGFFSAEEFKKSVRNRDVSTQQDRMISLRKRIRIEMALLGIRPGKTKSRLYWKNYGVNEIEKDMQQSLSH